MLQNNIPNISFEEFTKLFYQTYNSFNWSLGQTLMIVLYCVWTSKHEQIVNTEYDTYNNESAVDTLMEKLKKEWLI